MESKPVILKISMNFKPFLEHFHKNIKIVEHIFSTKNVEKIFQFEATHNGVFLIYRDLKIFQLLMEKKNLEQTKITKNSREANIELIEKINEFYQQDKFIMEAECTSHPFKNIFPYLENYYTQIHSDVTVIGKPKYCAQIIFNTPESLIQYYLKLNQRLDKEEKYIKNFPKIKK